MRSTRLLTVDLYELDCFMQTTEASARGGFRWLIQCRLDVLPVGRLAVIFAPGPGTMSRDRVPGFEGQEW